MEYYHKANYWNLQDKMDETNNRNQDKDCHTTKAINMKKNTTK